jgi:hypothetical protein
MNSRPPRGIYFASWLPKRVIAICVFGLIFFGKGCTPSILFHEIIHRKQQLELLIIGAYVIYALDYLCKLLYYRSRYLAYYNTAYEREARHAETNHAYIVERKPYSFYKFFIR